MSEALNLEVPDPLHKFIGNRVVHSENQRILSGYETARILTKQQLKRAQKQVRELDDALQDIDELLTEEQRLIEEVNELKLQVWQMKLQWREARENRDVEEGRRLRAQADIVRANHKQLFRDKAMVARRLRPYRRYIVVRNNLRARIHEHHTALEDQKIRVELRKSMAREANLLAEIIIRTWNALGYCHEVTVKNRVKRRSVQFERIVATEDSLQFKILASRMALIRGTIYMLPPGVRTVDLTNPDTLEQLTIACERPITCPQEEDKHYHNGKWLVAHREGLVEGILTNVSFKHVMSRYEADQRMKFPLPMGVRAGRHINWVRLVEHPHLLVAGQTGSGKSNAINVAICTLIRTHKPDEVRFLMIDLKEGVELRRYRNVPHVLGEIVTEIDQVARVLYQMELLRKQRMYEIRQIAHDIDSYNQVVPKHRKMPRIVIVFDEYGALAIDRTAAQYIYDLTAQLAMKSRAAGIHLLIGAQTPYNDVIPNKVKSNITFALAGRQRTLGSSYSTVGSKAAAQLEKLPGRMLCDDGVEFFQVQLPYASPDDIQEAIVQAMAHEEPRHLELTDVSDKHLEPGAQAIKPFDEEDFLRVLIDEFNGVSDLHGIYRHLNGDVPRSRLQEINRNIKGRSTVELEGRVYQVIKVGTGYKLENTEIPDYQQDDTEYSSGIEPVFHRESTNGIVRDI